MATPRRCTICERQDAAAIDARLDAGEDPGAIRQHLGLGHKSWERHLGHRAAVGLRALPDEPVAKAPRPRAPARAPQLARPDPDEAPPTQPTPRPRPAVDVPPDPKHREGRVRAVMLMIANLQWIEPHSSNAIREAWDLSEATVSTIVYEARRRLDATLDDREMRNLMVTNLLEFLELARTKEDPRAGAVVIKTLADILGMARPAPAQEHRHEHVHAHAHLGPIAPAPGVPAADLQSLLTAAKAGDQQARTVLEEYARTGHLPARKVDAALLPSPRQP